MPKRSYHKKRSFKKKRRGIGRPKTQFINQLGGWSSYPGRRSRPVLRQFTTHITQAMLSIGAGDTSAKGVLTVDLSAVPQAIKNVYQRIRIKKVEGFFKLSTPTGNLDTLQLAVCRALADNASLDPINVPGADIKMVDLSTSTGPIPQEYRVLAYEAGEYVGTQTNRGAWEQGDLGFRSQLHLAPAFDGYTWFTRDAYNSTGIDLWNSQKLDHYFNNQAIGVMVPIVQETKWQVVLRPTPPSLTTAGADTVDLIRAARMYPPVIITGESGEEVPVTKENWIQSNNVSGAQWNCFNVGIYRSNNGEQGTCVLQAYYTVTLLCDGMKA